MPTYTVNIFAYVGAPLRGCPVLRGFFSALFNLTNSNLMRNREAWAGTETCPYIILNINVILCTAFNFLLFPFSSNFLDLIHQRFNVTTQRVFSAHSVLKIRWSRLFCNKKFLLLPMLSLFFIFLFNNNSSCNEIMKGSFSFIA